MSTFIIEKIECKSSLKIPADALGVVHASSGFGASQKAYSRIFRKMNRPNQQLEITVYLRKTNTDKLRMYRVFRERDAKTFMRGDTEVTVEYKVKSKYLGIMGEKKWSRKASAKKSAKK